MKEETGLPPLKRTKVGMLMTLNCPGTSMFSSTFIFTNFTLPAYYVYSSSMIGSIALHGPHHGAQKSTRTGSSLERTSLLKSASEVGEGIAIGELQCKYKP